MGKYSHENFHILKRVVQFKQFDWSRGMKISRSSPGGLDIFLS
jgi:hypothetical protein